MNSADFIVDKNQIFNLRSDICVSPNNIHVGFVGKFHPVKDYFTFTNLAEELIRKDDSFIFLMVGKGFDNSNLELVKMLK